RGAVADQVEGRRIGARGCDPVRVLARLSAPLEIGTGEEVGAIVIHERSSPHGQWRRILSGTCGKLRVLPDGARSCVEAGAFFPGASAGVHRARAMMAAPLAQRKTLGHQQAPAVAAATEAQLVAAREC